MNDFKDDLNKINDGINEITFFEFNKTFKKAFLSNDDNEKLKPEKIKSFNVFNNEFSTDDLNQFFKQSQSSIPNLHIYLYIYYFD